MKRQGEEEDRDKTKERSGYSEPLRRERELRDEGQYK
jgi:hypothetical protein